MYQAETPRRADYGLLVEALPHFRQEIPLGESVSEYYGDRAVTLEPSGDYLTHQQLDEQSARFVHGLRLLGATPEAGAVAWLVGNCLEVAVIGRGVRRAGYDGLALNTDCPPHEIAGLIAKLQPRVLVASAEQLARPGMADALQGVEVPVRILLGDPLAGDWQPYENVLARQYWNWDGIEAEVPGRMLLLSGGTTGEPKIITPAETEEEPAALEGLLQGADNTWLIPQPLYHSGPRSFLTLAEGHLVIMKQWNTLGAARAIAKYGVTHTFLVPPMMKWLLDLDERDPQDFSSLRLVIHSAAECPDNVKRRWLRRMSARCQTIEFYGASERVGLTCILSEDWWRYPGSVGKPVGGKIVIRHPETGEPLPVGETGVVWFVQENQAPRSLYVGDAQESNRSYVNRDDLWEGTTFDLGHVNSEGFLFLDGRGKDMIVVGGSNVYPVRVSSLLSDHSAIADVAAVGIPDEDLGEVLGVLVRLHDGFAPSEMFARELRQLCVDKLGRRYNPPLISFGEVPRWDTGKVRVNEVRARIKV